MKKYIKKITIFAIFVSIFFIFNISKASASTLYWFSTSSTDWNSGANWWSDSNHSIQASAPTNNDDAVLLGSVAPIANLDTWTIPHSINSVGLTGSAKTSGVIFTSSSNQTLSITVIGNATFNGSSQNTFAFVIGDATFNNSGGSTGLVFGNVTFNNSTNNSYVYGNATFNNSNNNTTAIVSGDANFINGSFNSGVVAGNANFDSTSNLIGTVNGNVVINFATSGVATLTNQYWGTVLGSIKGNDGVDVSSWVFNNSINYGTISSGTTTFNGTTSENDGTTTNAVFNNSTKNLGIVTGNAIFNSTSKNNGTIIGNATFNDSSFGYTDSADVVRGNAVFNGDSSGMGGTILGTQTRRYSTSTNTSLNFTLSSSPWIVLADGPGVVVHLHNGAYNASTTFATANGGSFDLTSDSAPTIGQIFPSQGVVYAPPPPSLITGPIISNIISTTTSNTATVTWNTNSNSSSIINASNKTFGLALTDTNLVQSHSMTLTGLASCSTYLYRVASADASGNISISTGQIGVDLLASFTTTGCTGNAANLSATSSPDISTSLGANITFNSGDGRKLVLNVPSSFTATSSFATFELNRIDTNALIAAASTPAGLITANGNTYQLIALIDVATLLKTFVMPLSITMTYLPSDIVGLDPNSLTIQRYDDGVGWTSLPNCNNNQNNYTITCTTDHFSIFSLFGLHPLTSRGHSGGHSGSIIKLSTLATPSTSNLSLINTLPTSDSNLSAADVASLKSQLNAKIADLMKQLIQLLTQRLNSLLGL